MTKEEIFALHPDLPKAYEMLKAAQSRTADAAKAEIAAFDHWTSLMIYHLSLNRDKWSNEKLTDPLGIP